VSLGEDFEDPSPETAGNTNESALWIAFKSKGSPEAREQLFSIHVPFARQLARRHFLDRSGAEIEFAELSQLACAGLLEALDGFNPDFGAPFRAYAARRISASILDGIAKMSEVRQQISSRSRLRSERVRSLAGPDGEAHSGAEAMQTLSELAVGLALGFMLEGTGLYVAHEQIDGRANAYESLAWKELIARVLGEISQISKREGDVIRHHYMNDLSFDQIGALLGVTKGRVSQLHKSALQRLKERLSSTDGFGR
jgi:RNA polymerase sigma factor for flagellar operon FliA